MNIHFPTSYCVYDTETTGLDINTCRVVELAVKRVVGEEVSARSWLIKPDSPLTNDELSVCREITHIDPEMLEKDGVPMIDAVAGFIEEVRGLPLVGHNILRYDNNIMHRFLPGGESCTETKRCVDTAALFKAWRMGELPLWHESHEKFAHRILDTKTQGLKFNLVHACEYLGIDIKDIVAHRADGDVEMVDRLYRELAL